MKRHEALQPLSREHHKGLLLCWKIKVGLKKEVSIDRIAAHVKWFISEHINAHFKAEEDYVFPILGNDHPMIQQALNEHERLNKLFNESNMTKETLESIEEELEKHIRFEERELFPKIEEVATPEQLKKVIELHQEEDYVENESDVFWR